ncbi:hypothetical protein FISHEDRAFT_16197, partial [Fistulina hepatica ATCC 64428]
MAELCEDIGRGRVSTKALEIQSNFLTWKQRGRERRSRLHREMELKKFGQNLDDEEAANNAASSVKAAEPSPTPAPETPAPNAETVVASPDNEDDEYAFANGLVQSSLNPRVRIGRNGEMVIDEQSLHVDQVVDDETANYTHVTESDHSKFINSGTYGRRFRGTRWSAEETELFYLALQQHGENYELISYMLPGRDRKACKSKFKAEDKKNAARINQCLNNRIPIDFASLSRVTGKDFSGPVPEISMPT